MHQDSHLDIRSEKCSQCSKSFRKKTNLVEHTRIVHVRIELMFEQLIGLPMNYDYFFIFQGGVVAPFACQYCDKRFTRRMNLGRHVKRHTVDTKKHKCQVCPAAFELKHDFKLHLKRKHNAVVPHIDTTCNDITSN